MIRFASVSGAPPRISLLLLTPETSLNKSLSHLSVALPGHQLSRRSHCATDRNEGSFMEPVLCSQQPVGSEIERGITIRSKALDAQIAVQEHVYERN